MAIEYKPRLCHVIRGANGYGFHLHGEKGKFGQCIRKVEPDSPAEHSGLKAGDRIIQVNGENIENESHQQVVARIKEKSGETILLVVDEECDEYFRKKNITITVDLLTSVITESPPPETEVETETEVGSTDSVRPRLCHLVRGEAGYGFNLHSEKGKKGRFIRSVDDDSPSTKAGLKAGDRIIEVNGTNMEYDKHADLVAGIKASGEEVNLLVVDEKADDFFKSLDVTPNADHVTGPLPTAKASKSPAPTPPAATTSATPLPSAASASNDPPTSNGGDLAELDLKALKERSKPRPKKTAPSSNWNNRQAIFNNL